MPNLRLILLFLAALGDSGPVTVMGETVLARSDLVAMGAAVSRRSLGLGACVTEFRITELLVGREAETRVLVLSSDRTFLPADGVACVVFLKRLGDARFEGIGRVDVLGPDGEDRLATLRRYLEIEAVEDATARRNDLRDYLLGNLSSSRHFLLWSSARELAHFAEKHPEAFEPEHVDAVRRRASEMTDPVLRELLDAALKSLGAQSPDPAPPPGRVKEAVPVDARGVPAPHEYREMLRSWKAGVESPVDRLRLVRAAVARHVKYALPILIDALSDADPRVREAGVLGLGEGLFAEGREPVLLLLAREKSSEVLRAAVQTLGFLKAEAAMPAIIELSRDQAMLRTAVFAAARIGGPLAFEWLGTLKALAAGETEEAAALRRTLEFIATEDFRRQEEALEKVRRERLR